MYNGVGLQTPRGTGTSGFIQRNAGQLAAGGGRTALMWNTRSHYKTETIRHEKGKDIREHEKKREVELKLLVERERMEDEGKLSEDEIEDELAHLRRVFLREQDREEERQSALPSKSVDDFAQAFNIPKDYTEGDAFDRDLQDSKKAERLAKKREEDERRERERLEREIRIEEEKLALSKAEEKERKRKRKEEKKQKKDEKKKRKKAAKRESKERKKREKKQKAAEQVRKEHAKEEISKEAEHLVEGEMLKEALQKEKDQLVESKPAEEEKKAPAKPARHDSDSEDGSGSSSGDSSDSSSSSSSSSRSDRKKRRRRS
eukprot:TRINITY_DN2946_c0_g1_i1.p1 TRINITY_DN2946_c0_g1~~TRINITY_DN2946_c0_g1_i1.p1  ORF type:complete len:317 (+),score=158.18 TRINITY_DN2946_c0_g1_i1:48-998(+)